MTETFLEHVENIIQIDDNCFSLYFESFNRINKYLKKENSEKSKLSIFLDQKFDLSNKRLVSGLNKDTNNLMHAFYDRQDYFYDMNWGYDSKQEMLDTYDHVTRKLKFENKNERQTTRDFNANKDLLNSIITFEEVKERISTYPESLQPQQFAQLELGFAVHVARYNHIRGTKYSTRHFKMS